MPLKGKTAGKDDLDVAAAWQAGTYEWWPEEDRLIWSCGLVRIYGLARAPAAEAGFTELVHSEDRIRVEAETADYLGSGALSYSHSFRIVRPDGAVRLILDRGSIERDTAGAVRVIRGLNVDVTDLAHADLRPMALEEGGAAEVFSRLGEADQGARSQAWHSPLSPEIVSRQVEASRAAADSDERLQEILEAADTGTWDWRVGAERPNWSPQTFELFGLDPAQGAPPFLCWLEDCVHPEDRARARHDLEAASALAPGQRFVLECRTVHRERGVRWMATSGRMTCCGVDGAARLVGVIADITERKAAEEVLCDRNRQLDLLAHTSRRLLSDAGPKTALLEAIFSDIAGLLGVESFLFYRPIQPRMLRLELAAGVTEEERQQFATTRFGELLCGRVAETEARLIVEDLQKCSHPGAAVLRRAGATSYAGFPLLADGKLLGTVCFLSHTLTHFRDGEVEVIQSICDQIAITLERRRLQHELEESEARQRLIMDNTVAFVGILETDGTLVEANAPALDAGGLSRDDVAAGSSGTATGGATIQRSVAALRRRWPERLPARPSATTPSYAWPATPA